VPVVFDYDSIPSLPLARLVFFAYTRPTGDLGTAFFDPQLILFLPLFF